MKISKILLSVAVVFSLGNATELFDEFKVEYSQIQGGSTCSNADSKECQELISESCKDEKDKEFCKDYTIRWNSGAANGAVKYQLLRSFFSRAISNDDIDSLKEIEKHSKTELANFNDPDIIYAIFDNKAIKCFNYLKSHKFDFNENGGEYIAYVKDLIKTDNDKILKDMLKVMAK